VIASTGEAPSLSQEQVKNMSAEMKTRYNPKTGVLSADIIPPNAVGNNQKIDVQNGNHTMNFALTKPKK